MPRLHDSCGAGGANLRAKSWGISRLARRLRRPAFARLPSSLALALLGSSLLFVGVLVVTRASVLLPAVRAAVGAIFVRHARPWLRLRLRVHGALMSRLRGSLAFLFHGLPCSKARARGSAHSLD